MAIVVKANTLPILLGALYPTNSSVANVRPQVLQPFVVSLSSLHSHTSLSHTCEDLFGGPRMPGCVSHWTSAAQLCKSDQRGVLSQYRWATMYNTAM